MGRPTDADRACMARVVDIAREHGVPEWALIELRGAAAIAVMETRTEGYGKGYAAGFDFGRSGLAERSDA